MGSPPLNAGRSSTSVFTLSLVPDKGVLCGILMPSWMEVDLDRDFLLPDLDRFREAERFLDRERFPDRDRFLSSSSLLDRLLLLLRFFLEADRDLFSSSPRLEEERDRFFFSLTLLVADWERLFSFLPRDADRSFFSSSLPPSSWEAEQERFLFFSLVLDSEQDFSSSSFWSSFLEPERERSFLSSLSFDADRDLSFFSSLCEGERECSFFSLSLEAERDALSLFFCRDSERGVSFTSPFFLDSERGFSFFSSWREADRECALPFFSALDAVLDRSFPPISLRDAEGERLFFSPFFF